MNTIISETIRLSLIIPVFNRPAEVEELLESLCTQTNSDFEVIIVEDGSEVDCREVVNHFNGKIKLQYHFKPNSGPGLSRNFGAERANGNYYIFLDSDCVLPPTYIEKVLYALQTRYADAFGGPDRAAENFSKIQKAISYAMTSFFTTGGIRGGGEKFGKFHPRSFNMGFSKEVYEKTSGFSEMRFGEDIDMSLRILKAGFRTSLIREAWVYHKRRTKIRQFFKQVYNSGMARISLQRRHPGSLKAVHTFPSLFLLGMLTLLALSLLLTPTFLLMPLTYALVLFTDSSLKNKSLSIGALSVLTSMVQLTGYGMGFLHAMLRSVFSPGKELNTFRKNFYK